MHRSYRAVSALFLAAALISGGSTLRAASRQNDQVPAQKDSAEPVVISIFTGKILSQNGAQLILRDDSNATWYHLDDQQQAGKFLGKNVSVTGILDQSTDTIRVRSIFEPAP